MKKKNAIHPRKNTQYRSGETGDLQGKHIPQMNKDIIYSNRSIADLNATNLKQAKSLILVRGMR
jgi:hypothetical protein